MKNYDHRKIESSTQKLWEKKKIYKAKDGKGKKFYPLVEFPYPSGAGLHTGHIRSYTAMDIIARKRRMEGYNVLYAMGWDAFGLPTENYAIKTGKKPTIVTKQNTDTFRRQLKSAGFSFDWDREINTTDPKYYKWTQWIFLQLFKKGLAYKAKTFINWCPKDKIGLANEEAIGGVCDRCGGPTEKREKEQWMLAITKYADRLDKDLDLVDYPDRVKIQQKNWIGKSEGAEIEFKIHHSQPSPYQGEGKGEVVKVFTTRADTIFGATYMVLAPEHELIKKLWDKIENKKEVSQYIEKAKKKSEIERVSDEKEKTGVELKGIKAINPASKEEIPVFVADYVLVDYGTGAIMAVPAHDERDGAFAKKYSISVKNVIEPVWIDTSGPDKVHEDKPFVEREVSMCIVEHWKEKKYIGLKWKKQSWRSFVVGGTDGEDYVSAGMREILEETGYKNVKFVKYVGSKMHAKFWAPHKNENRFAHFQGLHFKLENDENVGIAEDEKSKHEVVWLTESEMDTFLDHGEGQEMWKLFKNKDHRIVQEGILVDSGNFSGMTSTEAKKEITKFVGGKMVTKFKLRDWVFSRQRYWGEPIPLVSCDKCGVVPVPEKDLPIKLPDVKSYKPTDTGESPLAVISKWVNTKCPKCKGPAKRETDTMPNWAGSSWYFLRYTDPKNSKEFASKKNLKYWLGSDPRHSGVNWYNGGMEHTTLHLLYSRFWHKFLYDLNLVPSPEPYAKRTSHGMILGEGGVKMSKSLGNVVNPDDIVKTYGADTLRIYEMFMGPFEDAVAWSTESIIGSRRFVEKVWRIRAKLANDFSRSGRASILPKARLLGEENRGPEKSFASVADTQLKKLLHKTIKKVSEDIESMRFNTAISAMMILASEMEKSEFVDIEDYKKFLMILAPFAPHITDYLWIDFGQKRSIHLEPWPKWDEGLLKDDEIKIVVQINGKLRGEIMVGVNDSEEEIKIKAQNQESVRKYLENIKPKKIIYIKNRVINIVV